MFPFFHVCLENEIIKKENVKELKKLRSPTQIPSASKSRPVRAVPGLLHARLPELGSDVSAFLPPPDCPVSLRRCQVCKPGLIAEGKGPLGVTLARWQSLGPPSNASQRCGLHQRPRPLAHCLHLRFGMLAFLRGHAGHLGQSLPAELCDPEQSQGPCAPHSASTLGCCTFSSSSQAFPRGLGCWTTGPRSAQIRES